MENVAVPKLKWVAWDTVENNKVKGVRELRSQRSKRTELILVFLTWSMPRNIATPPPLDGMLVHRRVTPQQYVAGTQLYTLVKRDKVE